MDDQNKYTQPIFPKAQGKQPDGYVNYSSLNFNFDKPVKTIYFLNLNDNNENTTFEQVREKIEDESAGGITSNNIGDYKVGVDSAGYNGSGGGDIIFFIEYADGSVEKQIKRF